MNANLDFFADLADLGAQTPAPAQRSAIVIPHPATERGATTPPYAAPGDTAGNDEQGGEEVAASDGTPSGTDDVQEIAPAEPVRVQTLGEKYERIFLGYQQALDAHLAALKTLAAEEATFGSAEHYMRVIQVPSPYDQRKLLKKAGEDIRRQLERAAENRFAPVGGRLDVDSNDLAERFPIEHEHRNARNLDADERAYIAFSPAECWAYLEKTYGGTKGEERGLQQTALALIDVFDLERKPELKIVAGRTVLTVRTWTEKDYRGANEMSWSCREKVGKLFTNLRTFAVWAELGELPYVAGQQLGRWTHHSPKVEPRERIDLGDGSFYATYLNKFEVHLGPVAAEKLQLFIGQFGSFKED